MEHYDHLISCILSGQIPHEEVQKVFDRNPGLKDYYKQFRNLSKKEVEMDQYTEYGYRGLLELEKAKEEIEELKEIIIKLNVDLKKAEELIQMHAMR
jgi:hypothetical protein